jgi:hypothetical protein
MSQVEVEEIFNKFKDDDLNELQTRYFTSDFMIKDEIHKHKVMISNLETMKRCLVIMIEKKYREVIKNKNI